MKNFKLKVLIGSILFLLLLGCMSSTSQPDYENCSWHFNNLQKAYLDSSNTGVSIGLNYSDSRFTQRDSVKFYYVELDRNFQEVGNLKRIDPFPDSEGYFRRILTITNNPDFLPTGYLYEVGAIYMKKSDTLLDSWRVDTIIKDYFTFRVYGDVRDYQAFVDSFGNEPTVILNE